MLSGIFFHCGMFCTQHPWEMIGGTLTLMLSVMFLAFFGESNQTKICGWNISCPAEDDLLSSDVIILSIARCLAAAYIYLQFRKLDALGWKYVVGLAGLASVFFSFAFSASLVHLFGYQLQGLGDALPFFLLLLDLTKVTALAKYTLSNSGSDIRETVAQGINILGPSMTLDTLVEVLVVALGCLSGIPMLEVICCFGFIALISHYVVFMTFFPGVLCLILEIDRMRCIGSSPKAKKVEMESSKPNLAAQRVKLIISASLALVHVYSRLTMEKSQINSMENLLAYEEERRLIPTIPLWKFYLRQTFEFSPQQLISYAFIFLVCFKYIFYDAVKKVERPPTPSTSGSEAVTSFSRGKNQWLISSVESSPSSEIKKITVPTRERRFTVGNGSDEDLMQVVVPEMENKAVQTEKTKEEVPISRPTSLLGVPSTLLPKISSGPGTLGSLSDDEILLMLRNKKLAPYKLEEELKEDLERAVHLRRQYIAPDLAASNAMEKIPFTNYDYKYVNGSCCENVIGYIPIPLGEAGPLLLDGKSYTVPICTTEGCLVASTNRGCRAISLSHMGGVRSVVYGDGMTRAPVVKFPAIHQMQKAREWIQGEGFEVLRENFNGTSRYARLQKITTAVSGRELHIRFKALTGDAMGMNMVCKGVENALNAMQLKFPDMQIISLSGNFCTDKKPSAINWIDGRGKSVVCEAVITADVLRNVLKTNLKEIIQANESKINGSILAGSIGGFNAHAANIVTALFLATGQDPAQTVESSMCVTKMEAWEENPEHLYMTCTMPCIEVGTVGGGTALPAQSACLKMMGISNSAELARVICGTVLAAELSLLSALASHQLVQSHLRHNRSKLDVSRCTPVTSPTRNRSVDGRASTEPILSPGSLPLCAFSRDE